MSTQTETKQKYTAGPEPLPERLEYVSKDEFYADITGPNGTWIKDGIYGNPPVAKEIVRRYNSQPALLEAAKAVLAEGECYCADNVAVRGPCGYCLIKAAIQLAEKGQIP